MLKSVNRLITREAVAAHLKRLARKNCPMVTTTDLKKRLPVEPSCPQVWGRALTDALKTQSGSVQWVRVSQRTLALIDFNFGWNALAKETI